MVLKILREKFGLQTVDKLHVLLEEVVEEIVTKLAIVVYSMVSSM